MGKNTKKILKAKKMGDKQAVQQLQQDMGVVDYTCETNDLTEFTNLKGIFRAGIGRDNVPETEAIKRGVIVRYPSEQTTDIIFEETANFTCGLIFRMLYNNVGTIDPWMKLPRQQFSKKSLLVIGTGKIGSRVAELMSSFMLVKTFDILQNKLSALKSMMHQSDCITIHIPKSDENISFINDERLSWMKDGSVLVNTSRGAIVDEDALFIEINKNRLRAAFDVYWQEPYNGKLKKFYPDNFFMTPHVASTTEGFLNGCRKDFDSLVSDLKT